VTQAILHPELSRTLRAMGAPGQASVTEARARSEALALLERDAFVTPAAAYRIVPVAAIRGTAIDLRECVLHASALVEDPGELLAVAAAVCTLGGAAEQRVAQLFAGRRRSLALALDGVANELLFRLADRTVAAIAREARKSGWMPASRSVPAIRAWRWRNRPRCSPSPTRRGSASRSPAPRRFPPPSHCPSSSPWDTPCARACWRSAATPVHRGIDAG